MKKGQNNLQFEGNNYHHYHHALTFLHLLLIRILKRQQNKTKSSNIIYLNCPVQIFISIKQCIYYIVMAADGGEVSGEPMKTGR